MLFYTYTNNCFVSLHHARPACARHQRRAQRRFRDLFFHLSAQYVEQLGGYTLLS